MRSVQPAVRISSATSVAATTAVAAVRTALRVSSTGTGRNADRTAKMNFGIDPAKLDLHLDLDRMDFSRMVTATQEAIAHDRNASRQYRDEAKAFDDLSAESGRLTNSERKAVIDGDRDANFETHGVHQHGHSGQKASPQPIGGRTVRGIVGAGDVHDANSPAAARAQRHAEIRSHVDQVRSQRSQGDVRYTLMDTLRDCAMTGNWLRAYKVFESALEKSFAMVLTPTGSSAAQPSTYAKSPAITTEQERELWEALRKINAAVPPPPPSYMMDRSAAHARRQSMRNMAGVLRWGGGHYFWLLKTLLAAERVDEVERVWIVMRGTGFTGYQMDERTLNSLAGLLRRSSASDDAAQHLVSPIVNPSKTREAVERGKALKRRLIIELEEIAHERNLPLWRSSERTATIARIAEAIKAKDSDNAHDEDGGTAADGSNSGGEKADEAARLAPELRVGDFNGLLRLSQSHEGTLRILAMMEKLGVPRDATTLASIIAAHHSPHYIVEGATEEEGGRANGSLAKSAGEEAPTATTTSRNGSSTVQYDDGGNTEAVGALSREAYESYKEKRIASARRWFDECPPDARSAALYGEMLYLLRATQHTADFDTLLTQFRGNALRTADQWAVVEKMSSSRPAASKESQKSDSKIDTMGDDPQSAPALLPPAWTVPPSGHTYDLLVRRCCYRHDFEGMWGLFAEMRDAGVRGPARLYQLLILEAKDHPPAAVRRQGDVSRFVLEIYTEMRRQNVDVMSIRSTLNLVNAWSDTRSRRRWS